MSAADWVRANPERCMAFRRNPNLAIFCSLWHGVEDLAKLADEAGWQTLDEAVGAINAMQAGFGAMREIAEKRLQLPSFDLADLPRVPWATIHAAIAAAAQGPVTLNAVPIQSDHTYALPSKAQIDELARLSPSHRTDYKAETNDCDDQTTSMRGWLALSGYGNCAIGGCTYDAYIGEQYIGAHDLCIAVDDTRAVWFVEPRTGEVKPITHTHFGYPYATRLVITHLEF